MKLMIDIPNEWFDQMVREEFTNYPSKVDELCAIIQHSVAIPSAEPKTGQWKRRIVDGGHNADWKCSECGYKLYTDFVNYNFCPSCGARMVEPQESEDI